MTRAVTIAIRIATREDVDAMISLLLDDSLGSTRESQHPRDRAAYLAAFDAVAHDRNNEIIVAEHGGVVVAMAQLTYTPGLSRRGAWRLTIESVRVRRDVRGHGIGRRLMAAAIGRARARKCRVVQLTTDHARAGARAFYERLGFRHTHAGMKLDIDDHAKEPAPCR
jgi:ribosomal protein S18 acetylase RimI-like enzyme